MSQFIQSNRYALLILAIFAYTVVFLYRFQRKQAFDRGLAARMASGTLEDVRAHLYSKTGRKIYHEYELRLRELTAALRFDRRAEAGRLIEELSSSPMREKDFLSFQNQALNYAVQEKDAALAERVCQAFGKYKRHARFAAEARQVTDIYILHRTDHIEELLAAASRTRKPSAKATAYFRVAKQYHYLDRPEECRKYLEMAFAAFPDRTWQSMIRSILEGDYEQLD